MTTPVRFLRLEGLSILVASLVGYDATGYSWGLFAALLLAPDVLMAGYFAGPRPGALLYNAGHTYLLPIALGAAGHFLGASLPLALALIWAAHVGMDRALGYGLKSPEGFGETHLGGRARSSEVPA